MSARFYLLVALAALGMLRGCAPEPVAAQDDPLDVRPRVATPIDWTDSTRLALGQCLVAEARWRNRTEHSAIAHVLERRWRRYLARHEGEAFSFEQQIRAYCHVHRAPREQSSNGWALSLPWGPMLEDPGMGEVDWRRWRDDWDYVRQTVTLFERGQLRDPMPLAVVFGGRMDACATDACVWLGPTAVSVENGRRVLLHNRFYSLRSIVARAAHARGGR